MKSCLVPDAQGATSRILDLRVGDILLIRHKRGGPMRYFLRTVTRSHWDHVAMVLYTQDKKLGYENDILIESIQHGAMSRLRKGVEIHRLTKYLHDPELFDVGVKRFSWMNRELLERVRTFVLMNVDTRYYPLSTFKFFLATLSRSYAKRLLERQRFSCTGFVQKAFYMSVNWEDRHRVVFRGNGDNPLELQDLVTPADIASSAQCKWVCNKRP